MSNPTGNDKGHWVKNISDPGGHEIVWIPEEETIRHSLTAQPKWKSYSLLKKWQMRRALRRALDSIKTL